ncbi:Fic family protein [Corynebacterium pacaense]|uniref:Fic family protein n=1 Tax=Corynebacterium pacaense TaxID=1816684 RepID=UPI0015C47CA7|nr:Fic family protein [Corynebacterium pacaense]
MLSTFAVQVLHYQSIEGWNSESRSGALLSHLSDPAGTTPDFVRGVIDEFIAEDRALEPRPRPWFNRRRGHQPYQHHDYPVLWNTAALRSAELLKELEAQVSTARMCQLLERYPGVAQPDATGLSRVHNFILGDIYTWAGELRTIDLGRSGMHFASLHQIEHHLQIAGDALRKSTEPRSDTAGALADFLAHLIWAQPFREGNGKTAVTMILALHPGLRLDRISRRAWYAASVASLPVTASTAPDPQPWKMLMQSTLPVPSDALH